MFLAAAGFHESDPAVAACVPGCVDMPRFTHVAEVESMCFPPTDASKQGGCLTHTCLCNVRLCSRRLPEVTKAVLTPPHASRVVEDITHLTHVAMVEAMAYSPSGRPEEVGELASFIMLV